MEDPFIPASAWAFSAFFFDAWLPSYYDSAVPPANSIISLLSTHMGMRGQGQKLSTSLNRLKYNIGKKGEMQLAIFAEQDFCN